MDERFRLPEPRVRDDFRRELRARLLREARVLLAPAPPRFRFVWLRPALAAVLAVAVVAAGAGTTAAGSLPGDPAYGLKRAAEEVQLALTFDDVARVRVLAELSNRRLGELQETAVGNETAVAPVASEEYADAVGRLRSAVDALQETAPKDKRDAAEAVADAAREKHDAVLEKLKDKLPKDAQPGVERAIEKEKRKAAPSERPTSTPRAPVSPAGGASPGRPAQTEGGRQNGQSGGRD